MRTWNRIRCGASWDHTLARLSLASASHRFLQVRLVGQVAYRRVDSALPAHVEEGPADASKYAEPLRCVHAALQVILHLRGLIPGGNVLQR